MSHKRLTLLSDGATDQALLPVIRWLLRRHSRVPFDQSWADLRRLRRPPTKLVERVAAALDLYPCDILVIHRDAEGDEPKRRLQEIIEAGAQQSISLVAMVPVRMTEAWLLFDEPAIRRASGNPNGTMELSLPELKHAESALDPKEILHEAIRTASNLSARRRKQFQPDIRRVAELIDDFSPLCSLPSFCAAESSLRSALASLELLHPSR